MVARRLAAGIAYRWQQASCDVGDEAVVTAGNAAQPARSDNPGAASRGRGHPGDRNPRVPSSRSDGDAGPGHPLRPAPELPGAVAAVSRGRLGILMEIAVRKGRDSTQRQAGAARLPRRRLRRKALAAVLVLGVGAPSAPASEVDGGQPLSLSVRYAQSLGDTPAVAGPTSVGFAENTDDAVATYTAANLADGSVVWSLAGDDEAVFAISGRGAGVSRRPRLREAVRC